MKTYQGYVKIFLAILITIQHICDFDFLEWLPEPKWFFWIVGWNIYLFLEATTKPTLYNNYRDKIVIFFSLVVFELSFAIYMYNSTSYMWLISLIGILLSIGIMKFFGSDDLWYGEGYKPFEKNKVTWRDIYQGVYKTVVVIGLIMIAVMIGIGIGWVIGIGVGGVKGKAVGMMIGIAIGAAIIGVSGWMYGKKWGLSE